MATIPAQVYERTLGIVRATSSALARSAAVAEAAGLLGVSERTVYRQLASLGWRSGRKTRTDRGASKVSSDQLVGVAEVLAAGRNKRGQPNVPMKEAHAIAQQTGALGKDVAYSTLVRRLNGEGLGLTAMRAPEASVARCSAHPNHVWFIDVSVAVQWYFRDEQGRVLDQYHDSGARFYPGKSHNDPTKKLLRYCVTDHTSGCYYVRYYYSEGENALDVVDFLYRSMAPKEGLEHAFPFRGVPRRIVVDQGPAFKAALTQNLLDSLNIKVELHKTGNAKASGSVETRHNHWQRSFEGRLALCPSHNLDELNHNAIRTAALMTAERPLSRPGVTKSPLALWCGIPAERLILPPPRDVFLQLAETNARTGTLDNYMRLHADKRVWEIRGDLIHPKAKVQFRLSPYTETGVRVWTTEGQELAAVELRFNEAGFPENGRRHAWDDESAKGATAPSTPAQRIAAEVADKKRAPHVEGIFDDLGERIARQAYLAPAGQPWEAKTASPSVAEPMLSDIELREEVARLLDRPLAREEGDWWRARIGGGLTRTQFTAAWAAFLGASEVARTGSAG